MDNATLNTFRNLFLELKKNQLMNDLELEQLEQDPKGDEVDLALEERERSLQLKLSGRRNFFVKKIDQALERIEDGTFGNCAECEESIELSRLFARPTATQCISCKEEQERQEDHIPYQKRSHTHGKTIINNHALSAVMGGGRDNDDNIVQINRGSSNIGLKH